MKKTLAILVLGLIKWQIYSSNPQSPVRNVIKKLPKKCQPIIVSIFGNVLTAEINLNLKKEIVVYIARMAVLSALPFKKAVAVNWTSFPFNIIHVCW